MERETGIEPATNGLGSRDSTTELLPLSGEQSVTPRNFARKAGGGRLHASPALALFALGSEVPYSRPGGRRSSRATAFDTVLKRLLV